MFNFVITNAGDAKGTWNSTILKMGEGAAKNSF